MNTPVSARPQVLAQSLASNLGVQFDDEDLLAAPITDQERNSIAESNFLSNAGGVPNAA